MKVMTNTVGYSCTDLNKMTVTFLLMTTDCLLILLTFTPHVKRDLLHKVDVRGPREENIHLPKTFSRASKSLSQYSRSDDPFFFPEHLANLARSP